MVLDRTLVLRHRVERASDAAPSNVQPAGVVSRSAALCRDSDTTKVARTEVKVREVLSGRGLREKRSFYTL